VQVACAVMIVTYGVLGLWRTPYRDTQDRTQLTHAVHHPKLRGIFTNQRRAQTIQQLVDVLPSYVHAGDPVIAFEYIPMIHYLTDTVPYLYNPNPMYYSAAQFSEALERALTERRELPLLVTAKGDVDIGWPGDVGRGVATDLPKFAMMRAIMERFKQRYGYVKKWENNYFEIWRPAVATQAGRSRDSALPIEVADRDQRLGSRRRSRIAPRTALPPTRPRAIAPA
jgi:hypothetical protein